MHPPFGASFEHYEGVGRPRRNVPRGQGRRPEPMGIGESNPSRREVGVIVELLPDVGLHRELYPYELLHPATIQRGERDREGYIIPSRNETLTRYT